MVNRVGLTPRPLLPVYANQRTSHDQPYWAASGKVEDGRGSWGSVAIAPFPIPPGRRGRSPAPGRGWVSPDYPNRRPDVPTTPADQAGARVDCFPTHAAFPHWQEGRHPHCHFRGLLRLYTCYDPPDRSAAQGDLCHEAPALSVTLRSRSSATRSIDNFWVDSSSTSDLRRSGLLHPQTH